MKNRKYPEQISLPAVPCGGCRGDIQGRFTLGNFASIVKDCYGREPKKVGWYCADVYRQGG
jgi:hypothetical protein